jgi:hypothetical protein
MLNARSTAWTEAAGNPMRSLAASVAATNKCLAQSDKSDVGLKATKKRLRSVLQGLTLGLGDIVNLLFIWLGFAIVVGIAAAHRGRKGAAWLLLAVVTSPLIAGLLVLVLPDPNKERQQQELLKTARKCPLCAELVRREAIVCKHCGRDLPPYRDHRDDQQANELKGTPVAAGTYRGYDYVHFSNGTAELKLPSGKWRRFSTADDLTVYVNVIIGSASKSGWHHMSPRR